MVCYPSMFNKDYFSYVVGVTAIIRNGKNFKTWKLLSKLLTRKTEKMRRMREGSVQHLLVREIYPNF